MRNPACSSGFQCFEPAAMGAASSFAEYAPFAARLHAPGSGAVIFTAGGAGSGGLSGGGGSGSGLLHATRSRTSLRTAAQIVRGAPRDTKKGVMECARGDSNPYGVTH